MPILSAKANSPEFYRERAKQWLSGATQTPPLSESESNVEALAKLFRLASSPVSTHEAFALLQERG